MSQFFIVDLVRQDLLVSWVWAMVHSLWIGLILAFGFYSYLSMNSKATAHTKYRVGMALFLLLPIGSLIAFFMHLPARIYQVMPIVATSGVDHPVGRQILAANLSSGTVWDQTISHYFPSIFLCWCLGVSFLMLRMILGYHEISQLKKHSMLIENKDIKSLFESLLLRSGVNKIIHLATSTKVEVPITIGHLKPFILLPVSLANQLSTEETYAILAHELAHILRKDYLQNLFISLTEILFFFHPSVWWFASTIKSIREQCCDDIAIKLGAEKMALSKALITLEDQERAPLFAMAFSHKNQLLHRIQRLFDVKTTNEFTMGRGQAPIFIFSLAMVWMLTGAWNPTSALLAKANNFIPISKSFLWEPKAISDTTKPKNKIEKITKDNGKQKLELQLENKKIKELKVDDKVIAPTDYAKYKEETEALTKELQSIEMPENKVRTKVYSDYDGSSGYKYYFNSKEDSNDIDATEFPPFNREEELAWPEAKSRNKSKSYSWSGRGNAPRGYAWPGDDPIRINKKFHILTPRSSDHIKYIIEGDSTGLTIDGDKLTIKNDKGDVIIDLNNSKGSGWSGSPRAFSFSPDHFYFKGNMGNLKELEGLKYFGEKLSAEDLLHGALNEKLNDKIRSELDHADRIKDRRILKNKDLLDNQQLKQLKNLKEQHSGKLKDEWRDKAFFKDGQGFNLLSGKGNMNELIRDHLVDDHIIKPGDKYEFNITEKELKINGKKQDQKTLDAYKDLIQDVTGIESWKNTNFAFSGYGKKD